MSRRILGLFVACALMGVVAGCSSTNSSAETQPTADAMHEHKDGECCGSGGTCCK